METEQMTTLAGTLEGEEVPAILGSMRAANLLLNNANTVFGNGQGHPENFVIGLALTSANAGLGLDVGPTMAVHCKRQLSTV